jgi:probable rRNA maturation factor
MTVLFENEQPEPVDESSLSALAESVLSEEGFPASTIVEVTLVTDDRIAELNETHLDREGPTDVLAFPLEELHPGSVPGQEPDGPPIVLGDVVVAPSYVRRQADDLEVGFAEEMSLMVVHGILHLMGYDHHDDHEAEVMEERERMILSTIGVERR